MKQRFSLFFIFILLFFSSVLGALEPKGPLRSKNYYVPFLPFYSFPGEGAAAGEKGSLNLTVAQYYIQDIVAEFHESGSGLIKERFIDYEGYILEPSLSFNPHSRIEVGLTTRLHAYYGGFLDQVFEAFHEFFDFPNGGRESYPQNDVYINIYTTSGIDLFLDDDKAAIGDTDLYVKWSFLTNRSLDLALWSAFKIPTGSQEDISGSGYADLAMALLVDFHFFRRFAFFLETGVVLPGQLISGEEEYPLPVFHLMAGAEFMATERFSLLLQFKLNTSPIAEGVTIPENISYTTKLDLPLTNLVFGGIWTAGPVDLQLTFEEDAFTNNGADLIANFTVSTSFDMY
jgi:hypothetical protein